VAPASGCSVILSVIIPLIIWLWGWANKCRERVRKKVDRNILFIALVFAGTKFQSSGRIPVDIC